MANRPQQLTLPPPRAYTRTEFTALRARAGRTGRDHRAAVFRQRHHPLSGRAGAARAVPAHDARRSCTAGHPPRLACAGRPPACLDREARQCAAGPGLAADGRAGGGAGRRRAAGRSRRRPVVPAADCAAPGRGGYPHAWRARRFCEPPRRQLVATGAAHRPRPGAGDRRVAAAARRFARCDGGSRRRCRRAARGTGRPRSNQGGQRAARAARADGLAARAVRRARHEPRAGLPVHPGPPRPRRGTRLPGRLCRTDGHAARMCASSSGSCYGRRCIAAWRCRR